MESCVIHKMYEKIGFITLKKLLMLLSWYGVYIIHNRWLLFHLLKLQQCRLLVCVGAYNSAPKKKVARKTQAIFFPLSEKQDVKERLDTLIRHG